MSIQAGARLAQIGTGTTAAERLRQAVGSSGVATAAALLVAWSGLPSASAATHLLQERVVVAQPGWLGGGGSRQTDDDVRRAVEAKREAIERARAEDAAVRAAAPPAPAAEQAAAPSPAAARVDTEVDKAGAASPAPAAGPAAAHARVAPGPASADRAPLGEAAPGEAPGEAPMVAPSAPGPGEDSLALLLILALDEACAT